MLFSPSRKEISATYAALAKQHGGYIRKEEAIQLLSSVGVEAMDKREAADQLWQEMGLSHDDHITEVELGLFAFLSGDARPFLHSIQP